VYSFQDTYLLRNALGVDAQRSGGIPALPFKPARPAAVAPNRLL